MSFFSFLTFSDTAKSAIVARNILNGLGYGLDFSFFGSRVFENLKLALFSARGVLPVTPYLIASYFKVFGVNDFAVIATFFSSYLLLAIFTFLLSKKLFNSLVGLLSGITVALSPIILNYAKSGASEILLMTEVVASAYFLTLRKKWATIIGFLLLVLSYFTRPHAFIFIAGLISYFLFCNFKLKKAFFYFLGILGIGLFIDYFIFPSFLGRFFLYSVTKRGLGAAKTYFPGVAVSDALRGGVSAGYSWLSIAKKFFYNLYNFYKLLPQIMSPYMAALFVIGLFIREKTKEIRVFKTASLFIVILTFLVVAVTIPFFRYLHPIIPFVYIIAAASLTWIVRKMTRDLKFKIFSFKVNISKTLFATSISAALVLFFVVGQTLGIIFLDSRFERRTKNIGKTPVYAQLSFVLRDNTSPKDIIITNLDTWGSWYGERRTVWFPLTPDQLKSQQNGETPFDAIYLTSYLMDDENYYMGDEWRQIFNNPEKPENDLVYENFELKGVYNIKAESVYENKDARAVLLVRKSE